jgi:hypothetical protein
MSGTLMIGDVIFSSDNSSSNTRITNLETNSPNSVVTPIPSKSTWDSNISSNANYYNNKLIIDASAAFIDATA